MKKEIKVSFNVDFKFWSFGLFNLNLHSKTLGFEILCFSLYIDFNYFE